MNKNHENNYKMKKNLNNEEEKLHNFNSDNDNMLELNSITIKENITVNGETNGGGHKKVNSLEIEYRKESEKGHGHHVVFDLNVVNAENKEDLTLKIDVNNNKDNHVHFELEVISEEQINDINRNEAEKETLDLKDNEENSIKKLLSSQDVSKIQPIFDVKRIRSYQDIRKIPSLIEQQMSALTETDEYFAPKTLVTNRCARPKNPCLNPLSLDHHISHDQQHNSHHHSHHHSHHTHHSHNNHNTEELNDIVKIPSHLSVSSTHTVCSEKKEEDLKIKTVNLFFQMVNISLGYFLYGYETGVFNQIQENIAFDLEWKDEDKTTYLSLVSVMIAIGATFGSIITGKIASILGRKLCYIILDVILIVGTSITLFLNTYSMIVGRFIIGYAVGGYVTLVPMTMKETVPVKYEGYGTAMYNISYNIGMLFAFSLGMNTPSIEKPDLVWWRVCFGLPIVFALINMILLLTHYKLDTPKHLLEKGDRDGAIESFKYTYEDDNDINGLILTLEENLRKKEQSEEITYKVILGPRFAKQLFLGCILMIVYQATCLGVFNYYSTKIFARTMSYKEANLFTTIKGVCRFTGSILSIFIFGRVPNKVIALVGFSIICGCLLSLSICDHFEILEPQNYIILFHYLCFGASAMAAYKITAEILPDIGIGIASLVHWIVNCIIVLTLPFMLLSVLAFKWTIMLYASVMVIGIIIIGIFYKDAHGLCLDEVENLYKTWF